MATGKAPAWAARYLRRHRRPWTTGDWMRFLLTLSILLFLSIAIGHLWPLEYAGLITQEAIQRSLPGSAAEYTRIVTITRDELRDRLDDAVTAESIGPVIRRVLEFQPAVLVVDLDTSARRFLPLRTSDDPRIVWARDAEEEIASGGEARLRLLPVLGGSDDDPKHWGLALFPRSPDWTVRKYQRTYDVGTRPVPSLHWAALTTFCAGGHSAPGCSKTTEDNAAESSLIVPLRHARFRYDAWHLADVISPAGASLPVAEDNPLRGKVVLFGGAYSPQDRHATPFGPLDGVELVANAIEAELVNHEQRELQFAGEIVMKVLLACLVALLHTWLRPLYALLATTGLLSFLVLFGTLVAAYFAAYRANAVPFLVGIWIEQLYGSAAHAQELEDHVVHASVES